MNIILKYLRKILGDWYNVIFFSSLTMSVIGFIAILFFTPFSKDEFLVFSRIFFPIYSDSDSLSLAFQKISIENIRLYSTVVTIIITLTGIIIIYFLQFELKKEIKNKIKDKMNLKSEIEIRKSLEKRMKSMVAQYSHTMGNTIFPDLIYKVAEKWKGNADFRKDYLVLLRAYHSEVLLKHQSEMLRVKNVSDDGSEFRRFILGDRLQEGSDDDSVAVIDILCYAAERVVDRLLNQNYSKLKLAQAKLVKKSGMDLDTLRNDFEDKVYFEQKQTVLKWINEKLAKTKIGKLSPSWGKVLLRKDGYAHALLQGHFGEIFFNAFKYANHDEEEFLTIKFKEHTDNNHTWLQMTWENPCAKTGKNTSGEGMEGIVVDLNLLNQNESENFTLNSNIMNNFFQLNLNYRGDMLLTPKEDTELSKNFFN